MLVLKYRGNKKLESRNIVTGRQRRQSSGWAGWQK